MSSDVTVVARNVEMAFSLTKSGSSRSLVGKKNRIRVDALRGVSFIAYEGDAVGILGRNGSGKSTLMSIISGGLSPSGGAIKVKSQPTLLSVSAALQNHLSGAQNARLGLLAKGVHPVDVSSMVDEILAWADLKEAAIRPLKTYSSGMKARLKFAIATAVPSEILLIDEALATGDSAFAAKAKKRMETFLGNTGTMMIVSHSASSIRRHCNRAIWLNDGEIIADGGVAEVSKSYERWNRARAQDDQTGADRILSEMRSNYVRPSILFESEAERYLSSQAGRSNSY
ncbi:ABC transporter ATP-binding protein [Corynebacterium tuberculostearicum]|uniref:ABC transporter ATP-binding protein n=1 Tax=Corynebacterium tuberculostearicum TaxID=38304 RepID=UPI0029345F49|nr:ABC transporter ATP-binding protein [Corynebacterium tuberculostearicum]MDV2431449.1 ABC transporter ATP-binding protein [Corynebacterium tuberculostearicum]